MPQLRLAHPVAATATPFLFAGSGAPPPAARRFLLIEALAPWRGPVAVLSPIAWVIKRRMKLMPLRQRGLKC